MSEAAGSTGPLREVASALDRLTRPPLLGAFAGLLLALSLLVVGAHLATLRPPPTGDGIEIGTGDFLAFWTGAVALDRDVPLYDWNVQQGLQTEVVGPSDSFQGYLNPPLLAAALQPLVRFGYLPAYYAFVAACALASAGTLFLLARSTPRVAAEPSGAWTLAVVVLGFHPVLRTTFGGQNTPFTLFLMTALFASLRERPALAAVALGLLTFKPQYALGLGFALLLAGHVRVVAGGAAIGGLHYLLGAALIGPRWPLEMLRYLREYRPAEMLANADTHFSWALALEFALPAPVARVLGPVGVIGVVAAWVRFRHLGREAHPAWVALAVLGTMLASPHLQYYEAALFVLPAALLVDQELGRRGMPLGGRLALAAAYVGYPLAESADRLGFQPLAIVLVAMFAWAVAASLRADQRSSEPS
jgi:hypothetical protein